MEKTNDENIVDLLEKELKDLTLIKDKLDIESLKNVDVIGFDVDHTLTIYNNAALSELLYTSFVKYLIEKLKYPESLMIFESIIDKDSKFNIDLYHKLSATEVILDIENGNVIKIDEHLNILKAFHGLDLLTESKITEIYGDEKKYKHFNYENHKSDKYHYVSGYFEYHVAPLFMFCVHLFDLDNLKMVNSYKQIQEDIMKSLLFNFILLDKDNTTVKQFHTTGYFFPEIYKNPEKYFHDYNAKELLIHLRERGVKVFIATNSFYEYAHFILEMTIGKDYLDYVDLCFYYSRKPGFFKKETEAIAFYPDITSSTHKGKQISAKEIVTDDGKFEELRQKKGIIGGSYLFVEEYFKKILLKETIKCLYVGDNVFTDCYFASKLPNWSTIAVAENLKTDYIGKIDAKYSECWHQHSDENDKANNLSKNNTYIAKVIRENTILTVSNIGTLKYLYK